MPVNKISANDFADRIASGVNDRDPTLDTRVGSIRDIFIDPVAGVLENQNDRVVYLNNLINLNNAVSLVPDDVDDVVANENIVRWEGSRSLVTLTFSRSDIPTADITVPVNFPVATVADPNTGNTVNFKTIETQTLYVATLSRYYNFETRKYELDVLAASVSTGVTAEIGAFTINRFLRPLPGFLEVTNKFATTSGRGIETNEEIAKRYFLHVEGAQIGTPAGIQRFVLDNINSITDVYVVYGTDTNLTRQESDAGAIDVWFLGNSIASRIYTTYYNGTETLNPVDFQPLYRVVSVVSGATTYIEGTDYEVVTGVGEYSYSNLAQDGIRWISGGSSPNVGDSIVITYEYNSLCNVLDSYFKQDQYYEGGSDRLFRWSQSSQIQIEANLKVRSGSPSEVQRLVREGVLTYINSLKLGENVEEFDIDSVVAGVFGVDNWTYTTLSLVGGTGVGDIEISPKNYARLESSDFVINLV